MICCGECLESNTIFCHPCDAERVYIFDVDGTLCDSRQPMDTSFKAWFIDWARRHSVYLVTGSDYAKTREQLSDDTLRVMRRSYNCNGNDVWRNGSRIYTAPWMVPSSVIGWLTDQLTRSDFPLRTGQHIEYRPGMLNFSIVGRGATQHQRKLYTDWDLRRAERATIATAFNKTFPNLLATVGGETGLDIAPRGQDKSQICADFVGKQIVFCGDMTMIGGNDYLISKKIETDVLGIVYQTNGWSDTLCWLVKNWNI
jgi:phosphomannomutase